MNVMQKQALAYVKNTGGGATLAHFVEDHDPVGTQLWLELKEAGCVEVIDGRIWLTDAGLTQLM